ncbi:MAG: DUF362 domain-containing protein [Candidatus Omnitrophota bacterium]
MKSKVAIIKCISYESPLVQQKVREAVGLIGGMAAFIKPQSRVLVKPNLLMAKGPEFGIDTHPEVVRAVIKLLKEIECKIFVGDGPSVWGTQAENVDDVYERSGIRGICEQEGVDLVKFEHRRWRGKFPLTTWLDNVDFLVNVPKFKTHDLTLLTGAVKNLFGLVSGNYKTELHKNYFNINDFSNILVDIFEEVKPVLTIVDGIIAMEGDGPATSGKLRKQNLLFASSDCVALDTIMAIIMGVDPFDVLSTKEAGRRRLGAFDIEQIDVFGERLEKLMDKPFILPSTSFKKRIPPAVVNIAKHLIRYYPCVERDNCIKCSACIEACPNKAIRMDKNKGIVFDYSKCIACFCCQEACPAAAIKVKKSFFAKLIGL